MEQASSADGILLRVDSDFGLADVRRAVNGAGLEAGSYPLNPVNESGFHYATPERPLPLGEAWPIVRSPPADRLVAYAEVHAPVPGIDAPRYKRSARQFDWGETPNKPYSKDPEWSLKSARVLDAWKLKKAPQAKDVRIGHPDTGYRRHPDIDDRDRLLTDLRYGFTDGTGLAKIAAAQNAIRKDNQEARAATIAPRFADEEISPIELKRTRAAARACSNWSRRLIGAIFAGLDHVVIVRLIFVLDPKSPVSWPRIGRR